MTDGAARAYAELDDRLDRCAVDVEVARALAGRLLREAAPLTLDDALDRQIADAARRYISAWRSIEAAEPGGFLEALRETDAALHDLAVLVEGECLTCDAGSCPSSIETVEISGERL